MMEISAEVEPEIKAQRLCNEIQLFELCDLEQCNYRNGRFCSNDQLLTRFEAISERDAASMVNTCGSDESDEDDDFEGDDELTGGYEDDEESEDW